MPCSCSSCLKWQDPSFASRAVRASSNRDRAVLTTSTQYRESSELPLLLATAQAGLAIRLESRASFAFHAVRSGQLTSAQDVSDFQWNVFRFKLPVLVFLVLLWVGAAKVYRKRMGDLDVAKRTTFILAFAALLLVGLHGTSLPKMFFLVWVNFCISRLARTTNNGIWTKLCPVITWIFNLHVLFSNEIYDGYKYGSLLPALQFLVRLARVNQLVQKS